MGQTRFFQSPGRIAVTAAFLLFLFNAKSVVAQDNSHSPSTTRPVWKADLRTKSFPAPPSACEPAKFLRSRETFEFVDSETLLVAWVAPDTPIPALPPRDQKKQSSPPTIPAHLRVLLVDSRTGQQRTEHDWAVPSWPISLQVTGSGNLLLRAEESLRLYSRAFQLLQEKEIHPTADSSASGWTKWPRISASGQTLLFCVKSETGDRVEILKADSLQELDRFQKGARCLDYAVSDASVAILGEHPTEPLVRNFYGAWQVLKLDGFSIGKNLMVENGSTFLNNSTLFGRNQIEGGAITLEGTTLVTWSFPKKHPWWKVVTSRGGEYFGVVEGRIRGNQTLDMDFATPYQLHVFSLAEKREVFRVEVPGQSPWILTCKQFDQEYALSPDGSLVAVLTNGVVMMYEVR
jgi:hypothetical protein